MTTAAGSLAELKELHSLVTRSYTVRIKKDLDDDFPTDAATLSSAVKFLKDNAVTADPAEKDNLKGLQAKLKEAAEKRRVINRPLLAAVQNDLDEAM